jgi:hypothetical protein
MSMRAITYQLELKDDHVVTITLPKDVPVGKHQIIVVIDDRVKDTDMNDDTFGELLLKTSGLWKQGDGLHAQEKIRDEWNREL